MYSLRSYPEPPGGPLDIVKNWWGSAGGPDPAKLFGDVAYSPWCADVGCSPLVAPSDLNATGASCSQIDLTWADNSLDETNFRIERSPDGSTNWIEIATVNADVVTYSNTGLSSATKYYYQVRAYRVSDGAFSGYSNIANATTQTCTAILAITPSVSTVAVGQDFDLVLEVQAGTQVVDGAAAYLNFDKTYLQVVSITPGSSLPEVLENNFDNATGQLNFAAGVLPPDLNPTGTFTLATVTFHAQTITAGTSIHFYDVDPRMSDITFGGQSILGETQDGSVTITPMATTQGSVTLQGRPTPPAPRWITPLSVYLTNPGQMTPLYSFTPTTNDSGIFILGEIPPGTYDVYVKNIHTLQNKKAVTFAPGANLVDFGTLKEGDANNNNSVTLIDFSILSTTYFKCQGTFGYDDRADFNEDNCVGISDFSLLSTNFGQAGPIIITSNPEINLPAPVNPQAGVLIVVIPSQGMVQAGDTFNLTVQLQSGSQLMDGAQADLNFDPTRLRVNSLTGNTSAFPTVLLNTYNNTAGTIDYAGGVLPPNPLPSGNVNLVVIQFTALQDTQLTNLTFQYDGVRTTDVTYEGNSILTGDVDGQLQIGLFNKTTPANGTIVPIAPTLSWTTSLGVTQYEYCLNTTNVCNVWTTNGTATSKVLSGLSYSTTYYWHVRAVNGIGTVYSDGSSAAIWSFTTTAPTPVRLANFNAISLPQGIQLSWQSAQENDLIGFNLYRAESPDGAQVQINTDLIPAINPGQLGGNDYQYLDATAETGKVYYYWIEWVGNQDSELFGPAMASLQLYHVWLPIGLNR